MMRLSEAQKAILNCYTGTKDEVAAEIRKAIPFIEDDELREDSQHLLERLTGISEEEFKQCVEAIVIDSHEEISIDD